MNDNLLRLDFLDRYKAKLVLLLFVSLGLLSCNETGNNSKKSVSKAFQKDYQEAYEETFKAYQNICRVCDLTNYRYNRLQKKIDYYKQKGDSVSIMTQTIYSAMRILNDIDTLLWDYRKGIPLLEGELLQLSKYEEPYLSKSKRLRDVMVKVRRVASIYENFGLRHNCIDSITAIAKEYKLRLDEEMKDYHKLQINEDKDETRK